MLIINLYRNKKIIKIFKYLVSGSSAAFVNLSTLYFLTDWLGIWYLISAVISFFLGLGVSFGLQKFWTFRDQSLERINWQASNYLVIALINLAINTLTLYLLVEYVGLWYILAQVIAGLFVATYSFFIYNSFIFNKEIKSENIVN